MTNFSMELPRILIIDDDFGDQSEIRRNILAALAICDRSSDVKSERSNYLAEADVCTGMRDGKFSFDELEHQLKAFDSGRWSLVLVDFNFSDPDGDKSRAKQIVDFLRNKFRVDEDVFLLFSSSPKDAPMLKQLGCKGYLPKPTKTDLRNGTATAQRRALGKHLFEYGFICDGPIRYVSQTGQVISRQSSAEEIFFGETPATLRALRKARQALAQWAVMGCPILIEGHCGDGKTRLGRYLHRWAEASLDYAKNDENQTVEENPRKFHVLASGELGAAFLSSMLVRGEFPAVDDLLSKMSGDTILYREIASFDSGTLMELLRLYMAKPPIANGLYLFTTSHDKTGLMDSGRVDPDFFSHVVELDVPPISLRRDSDKIFVRSLNKKRLELHLSDNGNLAPSAITWLQTKAAMLTFRQLEEMANLAARWQAGNPGVKKNHQIEQPILEQLYLQTRSKYQPKTELEGLLHRIKTYELSQGDTVQNRLNDLKTALNPLFIQILERAYSECECQVGPAGLLLGARRVDPLQQGNVVRSYFKEWFDFLDNRANDRYREKFERSAGKSRANGLSTTKNKKS